ncbi:MAG: response regulator [Desulfobacula sp.]|uniref:response regulator n=1 Tax=Desulfobacula sp. TaxID=2593537 RepID=UPI0025C5B044|nr:response regulator [Desulfobacula sp.]MCD4720554.1 response regulator [Desulfobacula sp.]
MSDKSLLNDKKVLIVDDEPDVLDSLEEMLDMCKVTKAGTFEEAKAFMEKNDFDLAILDIMGVDGYKLLNIAKHRNITAIMLTANALSPDNLIKSIKGGAASYLPKEEMVNITTFLIDLLKSQDKGESTWDFWHSRLSSPYFERNWGSDWKDQNKKYWDKIKDR